MNGRKLKLVPSGHSEKDYRVVNTNLYKSVNIKLPSSADLSVSCSPVKDQGSIGACTAFSTIGSMEYMSNKNNIKLNPLSERFTYYVTRMNIMNNPDTSDTGASIRDALKSAVKYGSCVNTIFPYNSNYTTAPSQTIYNQATRNTAVSYARYDDIDSVGKNQLSNTISTLKASLSAGIPIITGFTCYSNLYNAIKGVIPKANGNIIGGHAILLVGYDDSKQLFKFKNSWGKSWGVNGYGFLPYSYYLSGDMTDCWSIYSGLSNLNSIGLIVYNTKIQKQIVQNNIEDILSAIVNIVSSTSDSEQINTQISLLLVSYKSNQDIVNFINSLSSQITNLLKV